MDYYGVNEKTLIERRWKLINTRGKNVFNNLTYYIISITDHISSKRSLILVKNIFLYFYLKLYSFLSWKTDYRIKFCIKLERLQITWKNITKGDQILFIKKCKYISDCVLLSKYLIPGNKFLSKEISEKN